MKQKCELRRCQVLNPELVVKKKSVGMLGVGVNGDVRVKARTSRRSLPPPESREESIADDDEDQDLAGEKHTYYVHTRYYGYECNL